MNEIILDSALESHYICFTLKDYFHGTMPAMTTVPKRWNSRLFISAID
jgi:hypothetical protein